MDKRASRIFGLLVLLLVLTPAAFPQGMRYDNFVLKPLASGGVTPVSGALITVCTSAGSGTPCTPKVANIYSDEALATPITGTGGAGTTNSDANGNFGFYISPGSYVVTVTGSGIISYTIKATIPSPSNGVFNVGGGTAWAGSDIGAQINSAYAALPATGGVINVLPKTGGGTYLFTTPINLNTAKKPVLLAGVGVAGSTNNAINGGVILEYTPTTAGCAVNVDYVTASGSSTVAHGFRDIAIHNGHTSTQGGQGSSASGICIGNANGGMGFGEFTNVAMFGWGTAILNNDTTGNSWGIRFTNALLAYNTTAINWGASEEQTAFYSSKITQNGTGFVSTSGDVYFNTTSFDGNTVAHVNANWTGTSNGSTLEFSNSRWEFGGSIGGTNALITGNGNWKLFGGKVVDDTNSGTVANYFNAGGQSCFVSGTEVTSLGRTVSSSIIVTGANARCSAQFIYIASSINSPTFSGSSTTLTDLSFNSNNSNAVPFWRFEAPLKCSTTSAVGIGDVLFAPSTTSCLHLDFNSATFDGVRLQDHGASPETWTFGPGTGGAGFGLRQVAPNTQQAFLCAFNSPFNCTFSVPIINNGGFTVPGVVASGTKALNTASITTATCDAGAAVTATGTASTDAVDWSFNAAPTATNKYGAFLVVYAVPSLNTVTFYTCNPSATTSTPTAMTVNWSVRRP